MNTFGKIFRLTDFGETHGEAMGGIIDGCPAGIFLDIPFIQQELERRSPSQNTTSTKRKEPDQVVFLSGVKEMITTGGSIGFIIKNKDAQTNVENLQVIKPSHASYVYKIKYGAKDNSHCERASARQTVNRVVAGAVAKLILQHYGIMINSRTILSGKIHNDQDTVGAVVECVIRNAPAGLGEPMYDKFHARLAYAMLSIQAAKGFEIGDGFKAAEMHGSEYNDLQSSGFQYLSNHDGGVQAGITNGQDIRFAVAFKPIPSLRKDQKTINFEGESTIYKGNDRNDRCVAPRVLPVVEAMAAMVTLDFIFLSKANDYEK